MGLFGKRMGWNLAGAGAMLLAVAAPALAASETADLDVSALVEDNCTIQTTALDFGSYDPVVTNASDDRDGTGTITVACTTGATVTIGLGLGGNASGSTRKMASGLNRLTYELYSDTNRSIVWGNSGADLVTVTDLFEASSDPQDVTVFGRIAGGQDVPAGSYADTVVATVNF